MPLILPSNSISAGGYEVDNSLRFDDGSSDYLNRTPASAGNRKTMTYSFWLKKTTNNYYFYFFSTGNAGAVPRSVFGFSLDKLYIAFNPTGSSWNEIFTNALFRDVSAWYHVVVAIDTTQSTASNRTKIYVNGEQITSFSSASYVNQNTDLPNNNSSIPHFIGKNTATGTEYYDGYMAEVCFIDGQQLDPTSFREFDADTGIWKPIDVSGLTFGTNGFYLDFENSGSLGADVSGNGNNFTVNNLTSIDQTTDTPTNNYATWNPLMSLSTGNAFPTALTDGNTINSDTRSGGDARSLSTIAVPRTNKWYYECKVISGGTYISVGLYQYLGNAIPTKSVRYYGGSGVKKLDGTSTSYGATFTTGDIIGCLADIENNQITFYKNGASQGVISYTFASGEDYFMTAGDEAGTSHSVAGNFGNPAFTISSGNSDPNGYGNFEYSTNGGYALNTKNLAEFG